MRALSVRQPWAWAIIHAGKDVENRTWQTDYRGRLLIHASKTHDYQGEQWIRRNTGIALPETFARGAIIGSVDLTDVRGWIDSEWFFGPFGWILLNPEPMEPIYYRGRLRIFNVDLDRPAQGRGG